MGVDATAADTPTRARAKRTRDVVPVSMPGERHEVEARRDAGQPAVPGATTCSRCATGAPCSTCGRRAVARAGLVPDGGAALPSTLRAPVEARLGPVGDVRLHVGAAAARAANDVDARAYTYGTSIVFGADAYAPHTAAGRALLLHELAHAQRDPGGAMVHRQDPATAPAADDLGPADGFPLGERDRMTHWEGSAPDARQRWVSEHLAGARFASIEERRYYERIAHPDAEGLSPALLAFLANPDPMPGASLAGDPCDVDVATLTNADLLTHFRDVRAYMEQHFRSDDFWAYRHLYRRLVEERQTRVRNGERWMAGDVTTVPAQLYRLEASTIGTIVRGDDSATAAGAPRSLAATPVISAEQLQRYLRDANIPTVQADEILGNTDPSRLFAVTAGEPERPREPRFGGSAFPGLFGAFTMGSNPSGLYERYLTGLNLAENPGIGAQGAIGEFFTIGTHPRGGDYLDLNSLRSRRNQPLVDWGTLAGDRSISVQTTERPLAEVRSAYRSHVDAFLGTMNGGPGSVGLAVDALERGGPVSPTSTVPEGSGLAPGDTVSMRSPGARSVADVGSYDANRTSGLIERRLGGAPVELTWSEGRGRRRGSMTITTAAELDALRTSDPTRFGEALDVLARRQARIDLLAGIELAVNADHVDAVRRWVATDLADPANFSTFAESGQIEARLSEGPIATSTGTVSTVAELEALRTSNPAEFQAALTEIGRRGAARVISHGTPTRGVGPLSSLAGAHDRIGADRFRAVVVPDLVESLRYGGGLRGSAESAWHSGEVRGGARTGLAVALTQETLNLLTSDHVDAHTLEGAGIRVGLNTTGAALDPVLTRYLSSQLSRSALALADTEVGAYLAARGMMPSLSPGLARGVGGGAAAFGLNTAIEWGTMATDSEHTYPWQEYAARGTREGVGGLVSFGAATGATMLTTFIITGAVAGSEVPIAGNIAGAVVGLGAYLLYRAFAGDYVEEGARAVVGEPVGCPREAAVEPPPAAPLPAYDFSREPECRPGRRC